MPLPEPVPSDSLLARYRQLSPSASVRVSPLCLGAMNFGGNQAERLGECSKETAFAILDYYYSQGGNFIDTANTYQNEQSEVWLGEWLTQRQNRDEIVLATKYTSGYRSHLPNVIKANFAGNGTKSMKTSVADSLKKLQTTYIDLLYVHWWDYATSIPEMMHALNDLVTAGQVHYLGVSDTPAWVVSKANQYARDHGLRPFVVYQGLWNAAVRDFERDIIPMCRDEGMGLCPWGALGSGQFQTAAGFAAREKENPGRKFGLGATEKMRAVSRVLEKIATARGAEVTGVALAYVLQKTPYVFPIVGGRKLEHIQGNHRALALALSEEEAKEIEGAYPFDHGFPHGFLSGTEFFGGESKQAEGPGDVWMTKSAGQFDWVEGPKAIKPAQQ